MLFRSLSCFVPLTTFWCFAPLLPCMRAWVCLSCFRVRVVFCWGKRTLRVFV